MLTFVVQHGTLRTQPNGRLLPWLGPALRGVTAATLKERVCQHPPVERATRWRYCTGCPHQSKCSYGLTYEPDPPGDRTFSGRDHASRAVVLAPEIIPRHRHWDGRLPFELLLLGQDAIEHRQELLDSLAAAGEFRGLGLDGHRFGLVEVEPPEHGQISQNSLPAHPDARSGVLDRLTVHLSSPLFLRTPGFDGHRSHVAKPQFSDMFRASMRNLATLFSLYAQPLEVDFAALKFAAEQVQCGQHAYTQFRQHRSSNRTRQRFELRGVLGKAVFHNVPWSLIPWIYWGGRFHVGQHRVCGAGGWSLELGCGSTAGPSARPSTQTTFPLHCDD